MALEASQETFYCRTCLATSQFVNEINNDALCILQDTVSFKVDVTRKPNMICSNCSRMINEFIQFRVRCVQIEVFLRNLNEFDELSAKIIEIEQKELTISTGQGGNETCRYCHARVNSLNHLFEHIRRMHLHHACDMCESVFLTKDELKNHIIHSHGIDVTEKKIVKTASLSAHNTEQICMENVETRKSSRTARKSPLTNLTTPIRLKHTRKKHVVSHKGKMNVEKVLCAICGLKFQSIAAHIRKCRESSKCQTKPFKCRFCKIEFTLMTDLRDHHKAMHDQDLVKEGLRFQCELCGKKFARSKNLYHHRISHRDEKPYGCNICPKEFKRLRELKAHVQVHKGEKPFSCTVCAQCFRERSKLKRHMLIHTGEKPYTCALCAQTFARSDKLKIHLSKHSDANK